MLIVLIAVLPDQAEGQGPIVTFSTLGFEQALHVFDIFTAQG
jgi:hypothetical protein